MVSFPEFRYSPIFPSAPDTKTEYRKLDISGISTAEFEGKRILKIAPKALTELAKIAFHETAHFLRTTHLKQVRDILDDPEASANDRFVAFEFLKNAVIAAEEVFPSCQDTGTAIVYGKKGQRVIVSGNDEEALSLGIFETYTKTNLRYSQLAPLSMFEEKNTGSNLPAQFDLLASPGEDYASEYHFLFIAKGGGSANKSFLYQETRALLEPETLLKFIKEKITTLGTAACPPYHLAVVIGGTSAEANMKTAKLASTHYLDNLPTKGDLSAHAFRDIETEKEVLKITQSLGIGAQFGGKYFCHDVRVIRLPRHGASLPISIAVSCSADRQVKAKITAEGVFLEKLEHEPIKFLPMINEEKLSSNVVRVNLNQPMSEILKKLSQYPVKTRVSLTGTLVVARDIAHAKLKERLDQCKSLPDYFKNHPIYYAGPAKTPEGYASGSFGPTTAGRMDPYVPLFQKEGGSMIMLAKGNRSAIVKESCKRYGGFYLGSIGGPAAVLGRDCIKNIEILEFPELGMEAIWKIEVEDFPAFIITDDKGNDFFSDVCY